MSRKEIKEVSKEATGALFSMLANCNFLTRHEIWRNVEIIAEKLVFLHYDFNSFCRGTCAALDEGLRAIEELAGILACSDAREDIDGSIELSEHIPENFKITAKETAKRNAYGLPHSIWHLADMVYRVLEPDYLGRIYKNALVTKDSPKLNRRLG